MQAFTTTRNGPGASRLPYYRFNLGARCGDDPAAVARNRDTLRAHYALPGEPLWLHQVHGIDVARDDGRRDDRGDSARSGPRDRADIVAAAPGRWWAVITALLLVLGVVALAGEQARALQALEQGREGA